MCEMIRKISKRFRGNLRTPSIVDQIREKILK